MQTEQNAGAAETAAAGVLPGNDDMDVMDRIEQAIQEIETAEAKPAVAETPKPVETPKPAEPVVEAAKPVIEAKDPALDRGWERLSAREAEVVAKEKAAEDKQRGLSGVLSNLRRGNVTEAFKALGADETEIPKLARLAMASVLPADKVPDAYRKIQSEMTLDERFREVHGENARLRDELKQRDEQAAHARYAQEYDTSLESFLSTPAEGVPVLTKLATANKAKAKDRIMAVVRNDAAQKAEAIRAGKLKPEDASPLTPAEAAKIVESELAEYAALFGHTANEDSTSKSKTPLKGKPSLSNAGTRPAATRTIPSEPVVDLEDQVDKWLKANGLA